MIVIIECSYFLLRLIIQVNFVCDYALLSVAEDWKLRLLWASRISLSALGLFLFFGCDPVSELGAAISFGLSALLYLVSLLVCVIDGCVLTCFSTDFSKAF